MIEKLYWKVRTAFDDRQARRTWKRLGYPEKPFYDRRARVWRVFFKDHGEGQNLSEFGPLTYVSSEFAKSGLLFEFKVCGILDHAHSFEEVLRVLNGSDGDFEILPEFQDEYSSQELEFLEKFRQRLLYLSDLRNSD